MLLYTKLQEFQNQLERLKNDNTQTYEYAQTQLRNELNELVEQESQRIGRELSEDLQQQEGVIRSHIKAYALELFNDKSPELIEQILTQLPITEISQNATDRVVENAKLDLNKAFKEYLSLNAEDLSQAHRQELLEIITQKVREAVNVNANIITQEVIKELDFSFLSKQPQVFYEVIINSMGELLTQKCENEYLQEYFKTMGKTIYDDIKDLEEIKLAEFESLAHLLSLKAQNQFQSLSQAVQLVAKAEQEELKHKQLMAQIKAQAELEQQKLENAIALEAKRKELIESGAIPSDEITIKSYKVV